MDEIKINDEALSVIAKITSMFLVVRGASHRIAKGDESENESVYFGTEEGEGYGIITMKNGKPHFIVLDHNKVRYLRMEGFSDEFIDKEAIGVWKEVGSINEFVQNLMNVK